MPIVKLPKNEQKFLSGDVVRFVPIASAVPPPPSGISIIFDHNKKALNDIFTSPSFADFVIYSFNDQQAGPGEWLMGNNGGLFLYLASSRLLFFDPEDSFEGMSGDDYVDTSFTCYGSFDGGATAVTLTVNVTVVASDTFDEDLLWDDVFFLYQLRPAVYSVTDRSGNNTTAITGTVGWLWDDLFRDVISFSASPKSQIAVGASGAFASLLNGTVSWTFDGWFFPANRSNMFVLGVSENNTSKNTFFIRYSPGQLYVYWQIPNGAVLVSNSYFDYTALGANRWQYWRFVYDVDNNKILLWVNNKLVHEMLLEGSPANAAVGQLFLGGRLANANDNYVGRMAAARLTLGMRSTGYYDVDLDQYVGDTPIDVPHPPFPEA